MRVFLSHTLTLSICVCAIVYMLVRVCMCLRVCVAFRVCGAASE